METFNFVREKFREYYLRESHKIKPPTEVEKREFGFIPLKREKTMMRHRSFLEAEQMVGFIKTLTPSDAYYSSAYYKKPDNPSMRAKGWLGTDLVFDIDCDHIPTPCKEKHDSWRCLSCDKAGMGEEPKRCRNCEGERFETDPWICEECLAVAKMETVKLAAILEEDFGTSDDQIEVVFSGQRGYHIHVKDKYIQKLGADERKEIVDYVTGTGLNIGFHNLTNKRGEISNFNASTKGWRGRIIKAVYTILLKRVGELKAMGIGDKTAKKIEENRDMLLGWLNDGKITQAAVFLRKRAWESLIRKAIAQETVAVDTVVTTDIHRLIRLPSSLHGKTAFKVTSITVDELSEFTPLSDATAFKGGLVKIKVEKAGKIKIDGMEYGPYSDETVEIPTAPALFFICRGKATLP